MSKPDDWMCKHCNGSGMEAFDCSECSGDGWVDDEEDGGTMTCPECDGEKCSVCGGSGEAPEADGPAVASQDQA